VIFRGDKLGLHRSGVGAARSGDLGGAPEKALMEETIASSISAFFYKQRIHTVIGQRCSGG